jgi:hypothetical protein
MTTSLALPLSGSLMAPVTGAPTFSAPTANRPVAGDLAAGSHSPMRPATMAAMPGRPSKRDLVAVSSWHEAAHAVVGVRLGMRLMSIHVRPRKLVSPSGTTMLSSGFTSYELSTLITQLGRVEAHRACAVFAAAGLVAEREHGDGNRAATADDVDGIVRHGKAAGVQASDHAAFLAESVNAAAHLLLCDDGAAWLRVRSALRQQRSLSRARVEALVGDHR